MEKLAFKITKEKLGYGEVGTFTVKNFYPVLYLSLSVMGDQILYRIIVNKPKFASSKQFLSL